MHSHLRLNCVIKFIPRKRKIQSGLPALRRNDTNRPLQTVNDTRASGAMTTIRPAAIGPGCARGINLYYPLLPRQPRICNHQLSRRPPRHWPPSAIPGFNAAFQPHMSHVQHPQPPGPGRHPSHSHGRRPDRRGPPATPGLPGALPPAGHHDLHGPDGAAPGRRASRARLAAQHLPDHDTTGLAQSPARDSGADEGALEARSCWPRSPGPFFPSVPELSPPSASAASSRLRARPPWPSTPSTPSALRAIGPTTKNALHPARPLAHRRPALRHAARGLGPALRLLVLPRDRIRHRAGHRPGA